jgi:AcrR family transcriptional regulator
MPRTRQAFQQMRDERHDNILNAASGIFSTRGLAETRVEDLAAAAGISQGLLYRYFKDKEGVFIALLDRSVEHIVQRTQAAAVLPGTPLSRLTALTDQFLIGMKEEPQYFSLFSQAMALSGRVHETLNKLLTMFNLLHELVEAGQKEGEIVKGDSDQLVLLYLSCIFGLAAGTGLQVRRLTDHFPPAESILKILRA